MRPLRVAVFTILAIACSLDSYATKGEKYFGKVISAMGTYEGEISIRLNESNKDMIEIATYQGTSPGGGKRTESIKINSALVQSIVIDSNTYVFKNIEYAAGKYHTYCCIKLAEGSENLGLFQWGNKPNPEEMVLHHKMMNSFTLISSPTLASSAITWFALFKDCSKLRDELKANRKGFITPEMDVTARLQEIRRLITESADCLK
jgi:hypothetical protein